MIQQDYILKMAYYPFVNGFNADRDRTLPIERGGFYYSSPYRNQNAWSNEPQVSRDYVNSSRLLHVNNSNTQHTERYCRQNEVDMSMPFYDFKPNRYCHSAMGHSDVNVRNKESHEIYRSTSLERGVDLTTSNFRNSNFCNNVWDNADDDNVALSSQRHFEKNRRLNNNPHLKKQPFQDHKVKGAWVIKPTSNTLRKTFGSMNDITPYSTFEPNVHITVSTTNDQERRQRSVNRNDTNVSYNSLEYIPKTLGSNNKAEVSTSNTRELENSVIDRRGVNVSLSASNLPSFSGGIGTNNLNVNVSTSNTREQNERYIDGIDTIVSFATDQQRVNNDKRREDQLKVSTGQTRIHQKSCADKDDVTVSLSTSGNNLEHTNDRTEKRDCVNVSTGHTRIHENTCVDKDNISVSISSSGNSLMHGEPKRENNVTISTSNSKVREIRNTDKHDVQVNTVVDRCYPISKSAENNALTIFNGGRETKNFNVNTSASKLNEQMERSFHGKNTTVSFATGEHRFCNEMGERRTDHVNFSTGHTEINEKSRTGRDNVTFSFSTSENNIMHGEPKQDSNVTVSSVQSKIYHTRNTSANDVKVNTFVDGNYSVAKSVDSDPLLLSSGVVGPNNFNVKVSASKTTEQMERHSDVNDKTVSFATGEHRIYDDMEERTDHVNVSTGHTRVHEESCVGRDDVSVSFSTSGNNLMPGEPKQKNNVTVSTAQSKLHQASNANTNNVKTSAVVDGCYSMAKSAENDTLPLFNGGLGTNNFKVNMLMSKTNEQMERHFSGNNNAVSFASGEHRACNDRKERRTDHMNVSTGHTSIHEKSCTGRDNVTVSFSTSANNTMHREPKRESTVTVTNAQSKLHQASNANTNDVKVSAGVNECYAMAKSVENDSLPVFSGGMGANDFNVNVSLSNVREQKERFVDENALAVSVATDEGQANNMGKRRTDHVNISTGQTRFREKTSVDRGDVTVYFSTSENNQTQGDPKMENIVTVSTSNSKIHQTRKMERNDKVTNVFDSHYPMTETNKNDLSYACTNQQQCSSDNKKDGAVFMSKPQQHSLSSNEMFTTEYMAKFTNCSSSNAQCSRKSIETKTMSFPNNYHNRKSMFVSSNCPRHPMSRSSHKETVEYKAHFFGSRSKQGNKNSASEKRKSNSHSSVDKRKTNKEMQESRSVNSNVSTSVSKQQKRYIQKTDITKSLSYSAVDQYPWRQSGLDLNNDGLKINLMPSESRNNHKTVTFSGVEQRPWTSPAPGLKSAKLANQIQKPLLNENELTVSTVLDNYASDRNVTDQHSVQTFVHNSTTVSKHNETSSTEAVQNGPTSTSVVSSSSEKDISRTEMSISKHYQKGSFMMNSNSNSVSVNENDKSAFVSEYQQQFIPTSLNEHSAKITNSKSDVKQGSVAEDDEVLLSYSAVGQYPWTSMKIRVPTSQLKHVSSNIAGDSNAHLSTSNTHNQRNDSLDRTVKEVHSINTGHNLSIENAVERNDMFSKVSTTTSSDRAQCIENETGISVSDVFTNPISTGESQQKAEFSASLSNKEQICKRTEIANGIRISNSNVRRRPKSAMGKIETEYTSAYATKKSKNFSRTTIKKSDVTLRYKSPSEVQRRCKSAIGIRPTSAGPAARTKASVVTRPSSALANHKRCQSAQGPRHIPHPPRERCKSAFGTRSSRTTPDISREFTEIDVENEICSQKSAPLSCSTTKTNSVAVTEEEIHDDSMKITSSQFQNFKEMDRKMIGRMSKWQFGALLKLSGLALTSKEVDQLWATLNVSPDGMYSYSSLIKHFVQFKVTGVEKKDENSLGKIRLRKAKRGKGDMKDKFTSLADFRRENTKDLVEQAKRVQRERKERKKAEKEVKENKETVEVEVRRASSNLQQNEQPPSRLSEYPPPGSSMSVMSTKSVRTKELLVKIKKDVVSNWEGLKSVFKFIDKSGFATITIGEMRDVMNTMNFSLTAEEKDELCHRFDLQRNGRFHYLEFMKCFSQRPGNGEKAKTFVYSKHTHKLEKKQNGMDVTVANVLGDMRDKFMKEHKNLRRAFKKLDMNRKGYLSVQDFRKALKVCNVDVSNEDFYHLMTEFDKDITGRISYDNFLTTFIDV